MYVLHAEQQQMGGDTQDNCTVSSETMESIFVHAVGALSSHIRSACRRVTEDITALPSLVASLFFTHVAASQAF